jgi:hypothetical protein
MPLDAYATRLLAQPLSLSASSNNCSAQIGGVQRGAICRGVLEAADELGVDKDQVVDGFRKQSHRNALEDAERASMLTQLIGSQIPQPPFARPSRPREGRDKLLIPRERSMRTKGRRPSWK